MTDVGEIGGEPHVNPTASQEQDHIAKRAEEAAEKTNFGDSNSEHGVGGETKIDQGTVNLASMNDRICYSS